MSIYAGSHEEGYFHHSSFLAGKPVSAAGEIEVNNGILKTITDKSGHYRPTAEYTQQAVDGFKSSGIDISKVEVIGWGDNPILGIIK